MKQNKYNPNFHSGLFRNRISIVEMVDVSDEYGNQIEEPREVTKAWAML